MLAALILVSTVAFGAEQKNNCTPSPLFPVGKACVYGNQCESKFCCPYTKMCLVNSETGVSNAVMEEQNSAEIFAILSADGFVCDTQISYECTNDEETGDPFDEWDPEQCNCTSTFMDMYNAETWAVCSDAGNNEAGAARPASRLGAIFALALWLM